MYFKKLEIFGFKSFAEKTVLNFEDGITAVVGPNGCGKSNIFDSIRWVLGEQSVKQLRGTSKEDIIFNGTQSKKALNMAEVHLTFDNTSRMLPIEYDEVTVTRRLYRSGESQYLLNKTVVRLKDIQELFMGTGVGAAAYSLVQQGKVDLVVSAKPEDRRAIFDEASGITKYKAKKREALNKLKGTEDNLLRVNDITTEVKRQIGSIERQANKARKYQIEYEKLKGLEIRMARYQMSHFTDKKDLITQKVQALHDRQNELNQEHDELGQILSNEINLLNDIEQQINDINSQQIKLDGQIDVNTRQIGFNQERIEAFQRNEAKLKEQKGQLIERCRVQQEKIEEFRVVLTKLEEDRGVNRSRLEEEREQLTQLESVIEDSRARINDDEDKILSFMKKQEELRDTLTEIMKRTQGALARKRRLELELEKVSNEKQESDQKLQNIGYQINTVDGSIEELIAEKQKKEETVTRLELQIKSIEESIGEKENERLFLKSQNEFISQMTTQYEGMPNPIIEGRLIVEAKPQQHQSGIIGKVKEVLPLEQTFPPSFFQRSGNAPKQRYEITCEAKFIELDQEKLLNNIEMISEEITMLVANKESILQTLAVERGIFQEYADEIFAKEKTRSILEAQKQDVTESTKKLIEELALVDEEMQEVETTLSESAKKEEEFNFELDSINKEIEWCQKDIKEKQHAINEKGTQREELAVSIAQMETEIQLEEQKIHDQQQNLHMFSEALDSWLEEMQRIDEELSTQDDRTGEYSREIEELTQKVAADREEKESIQAVSVDIKNQKEELAQKIGSMRTNLTGIEDEVDTIKRQIHEQEMAGQELQFSTKGIKDRLEQSYKIDYDQLMERLEQVRQEQKALAESDNPIEQLIDSMMATDRPVVEPATPAEATPSAEASSSEETNEESEEDQESTQATKPRVDIIAETVNYLMEADEEPFDPQEAETELLRLRKRCDSFGNVNLDAMDEYEELKDRFEFLTQQQSDLLEAKSQLLSTISKINRSTRQMFMDTFAKVSEEFRIHFRMLFGGGEAQLILLDQENVLESGIDIIARPPGKKLQNISLLSGGEKTLTAIALIFGVFKVNPSPFCVLDEIDAALDESNVGRFAYLLQEFTKIAQFIVITHNKKTISSADVMYGITMPETGVSRIVSVKFADDEKNKKADEVPAAV